MKNLRIQGRATWFLILAMFSSQSGAQNLVSKSATPNILFIMVDDLRPEICTLDCGSLNFGDGSGIVVQTPVQLREQARLIRTRANHQTPDTDTQT